MLEEIKLIKTENKDLRSFGITFGIIFLIIAGFLFYIENESFQLFIVISSAFIIFGFLIPIILKTNIYCLDEFCYYFRLVYD